MATLRLLTTTAVGIAAWNVQHAWLVLLGLQAAEMTGIKISNETAGAIGLVVLLSLTVVVLDWISDGLDDNIVDD